MKYTKVKLPSESSSVDKKKRQEINKKMIVSQN